LREQKKKIVQKPPQKQQEHSLRSHRIIATFFGAIAAFFAVAFFYVTLVPFFQMAAYLGAVAKRNVQAIHQSKFIFSPYTYAQRVIRYEYVKYLEDQKIDKTTLPLFDNAIEKLEELVAIEGSNPYQHIRLGRAFEKKVDILGDRAYFLKADASYKKAIDLAPQRQEMYYAYGLSLVRQNRLQEAVKMLEAPPALDPDIPISYFYLGLAQFNLGTEAYINVMKNLEFFFQRSVDNPDPNVSREVYRKLLFYFYQQHDSERLLMTLERMVQLDSDNQGLYLQVITLMKNNNPFPTLEFQGVKLIKLL